MDPFGDPTLEAFRWGGFDFSASSSYNDLSHVSGNGPSWNFLDPMPIGLWSDLDLQNAYQALRDSHSQYFDTAYDFRDFLISQEEDLGQIRRDCNPAKNLEGKGKEVGAEQQLLRLQKSIGIVNEYISRQPSVRRPSSADGFHSYTQSHHSGRFSGYSSDRESPPRATGYAGSTCSETKMQENAEESILMSSIPSKDIQSSGSKAPQSTTHSKRSFHFPEKDWPFTTQIDQNDIPISSDMRAASDKAKRNRRRVTQATDKFFVDHYVRSMNLVRTLKAKIRILQAEKERYRQERDYFRSAFEGATGRAVISPPPNPPRRLKGLPVRGIAAAKRRFCGRLSFENNSQLYPSHIQFRKPLRWSYQ